MFTFLDTLLAARSMTFRDVIGHRRQIALLARALGRSALPPSLLFAGPAGIGKCRIAVATSQALNCLEPVLGAAAAHDACGRCAACRRIARGVHPDVLLLEPGDTGAIKIDQVRAAVEQTAYRPFEGRRRIVIIDDADAMVPQAQNALLKTLEEPPPASGFILVSPRADALLPTVRSRCSQLRFLPLAAGEVAEVLVRDHRYGEAEARASASAAEGSVRRALDALADDVLEARQSAQGVLVALATETDPGSRMDRVRRLAGKAGGGSPAADRDRLSLHLRALSTLLRDLAILVTGADDRALSNADLKQPLARLIGSYNGPRLMRAFTAVDRALAALERNASPKIVTDWLAFEL